MSTLAQLVSFVIEPVDQPARCPGMVANRQPGSALQCSENSPHLLAGRGGLSRSRSLECAAAWAIFATNRQRAHPIHRHAVSARWPNLRSSSSDERPPGCISRLYDFLHLAQAGISPPRRPRPPTIQDALRLASPAQPDAASLKERAHAETAQPTDQDHRWSAQSMIQDRPGEAAVAEPSR